MKIRIPMQLYIVLPCDTCISHNRGTTPGLCVYSCAFRRVRKGVVSSKLVSNFMCCIVQVKIVIPIFSSVDIDKRMGTKSLGFTSRLTNTANTSRFSVGFSKIKQMTEVVALIPQFFLYSSLEFFCKITRKR